MKQLDFKLKENEELKVHSTQYLACRSGRQFSLPTVRKKYQRERSSFEKREKIYQGWQRFLRNYFQKNMSVIVKEVTSFHLATIGYYPGISDTKAGTENDMGWAVCVFLD